MTPSHFHLNGFNYYSQYRKCGKTGCKCSSYEAYSSMDEADYLHGPYWYKRNLETGIVKYIGKSLPSDVEAAYQNKQKKISTARQELALCKEDLTRLQYKINTLDAFISGSALSNNQTNMLKNLGLIETLV